MGGNTPRNDTVTANSQESLHKSLTPLLVWAVVFCDIGTSVYYVPGMLYGQIGSLTPLMVLAVTAGFLLLAAKYVEICWRNPEGGGVVTVASRAFTPRWGLFGGLLITVDYFLTSAVSAISGMHYLGSLFPMFQTYAVPIAVAALILLAVINVIGIRESAELSLTMGIGAFVVAVGVVGVTAFMMSGTDWTSVGNHLTVPSDVHFPTLLVGFGGAWLAFSGLESISQLSPAMRLPVATTARRGMWLVIITVVATSPLLTLLSISILPEAIKVTGGERMISELADVYGGLPMKAAVVVTASVLLLFAANTAIIGGYHVFLALSKQGFLPGVLTRRNKLFKTPHVAIMLATIVPVAVLIFTRGNITLLGEMYAFGLLGAFTLSSLGLDVIRWRDGHRGWKFVVGLFTTLLVMVAWVVVVITKHQATIFGGTIVLVGMLVAIPFKQGLFTAWFYRVPFIARLASSKIARAEHDVEEASELISLGAAENIAPLYPSHTLVAVLGQNPYLIGEAIIRERGLGGKFIYAIHVEERPGLFVDPAATKPSPEAVESLLFAYAVAQKQGFALIPVWTISFSAAEGIARAASVLGVDTVAMGVGRRTSIYHLLRGHVIHNLVKQLPEKCHIWLVS
jgi:amino acid transporter/nucleotide-binding universal stress UspA family protein